MRATRVHLLLARQQLPSGLGKKELHLRVQGTEVVLHTERVGHKEEETACGATVSLFPGLASLPQGTLRYTDAMLQHILPKGFERGSVHPAYFRYVRWYGVAAVAGSMVMVFSTQSLLYAIGLGAGAIPAAAAINWVLKDGIGQLGGVMFASVVNRNFDADPKRWRFVAGLTLDASSVIEACTVLAPMYFLPLAALANVGKNVSMLAASAARAAIHISFARRGNLADITAKAGSQTTLASTLGTALGAALSVATDYLFGFITCACAVHLFCLNRAIRLVPIPSMNLQRYEMLVRDYRDTGSISTPDDIAGREVFVGKLGSHTLCGYNSDSVLIGPRMDRLVRSMDDYNVIAPALRSQGYYITPLGDKKAVLLEANACSRAVLLAVWEALGEDPAAFPRFYEDLERSEWDTQHIFLEDRPARVTLSA